MNYGITIGSIGDDRIPEISDDTLSDLAIAGLDALSFYLQGGFAQLLSELPLTEKVSLIPEDENAANGD